MNEGQLKANYHTHTWRCRHAYGEERAYVERAIEGGIRILGFSDHTPYPFPGGHASTFRMGLDQLEDYVTTVLELKTEYRGDIEIHLGVEAEYYPAYFEELQQIMSAYPVEYFLLGQHFLGNEIGDTYCGHPTSDPAALERYCSQVIQALETGCFTYLAHPDLIYFTGDNVLYEKRMRELCRGANRCGIPLEINFLGLEENRHYPRPDFWRIAGEEGCSVIFGADAHRPEAVWNSQVLRRAEAMVRQYGLQRVETVSLRTPLGKQ